VNYAFEIEKNVPPPPSPIGRPTTYGFERCREAGDSFLVPYGELGDVTTLGKRIRWAVKSYRKAHAPQSRWRTKRTSRGVRVWRIE
jgi:hypothetical protein